MTDLLSSQKLTIVLLAIGALLPYVATIGAKLAAGFRSQDNANPRALLAAATGRAARLNAAQLNSFEGLPLYFMSVLVAMYHFVPVSLINHFALMYLAVRSCYLLAYALNLPLLRSALWFIGIACCFALLVMAWIFGVS